jgi:hypothetical protein
MHTLLKPEALKASNVEGTTGGLFQDPSVGVALRVLPRFHPGLRPSNANATEIGVKGEAHDEDAEAVEEVDFFTGVELDLIIEVEVEVFTEVELFGAEVESEIVVLDTAVWHW